MNDFIETERVEERDGSTPAVADPIEIGVTESTADEGLVSAYLAHLEAPAPPRVLFLPDQNHGRWVYRESMAGSVKEAQRHGVQVAFLLPSEERFFLHEYSAVDSSGRCNTGWIWF